MLRRPSIHLRNRTLTLFKANNEDIVAQIGHVFIPQPHSSTCTKFIYNEVGVQVSKYY